MNHRTIRIDNEPLAVQRFFDQIGKERVVVEWKAMPRCVLYPVGRLAYIPEGDI
jgi:hypothetical protein